jgi:hypothetical protein
MRARAHTHTLSQYVTPIGVPLQQWLQERASVLRYTHNACLVVYKSTTLSVAGVQWTTMWHHVISGCS